MEEKKLTAQNSDPWRPPLEQLQGKIGDDGIERITTQLVFDVLEVPMQPRRRRLPISSETYRRARLAGRAGPGINAWSLS